MSRITFENFGKMAGMTNDFTVMSGRYKIQEKAEQLVVGEVVEKLEIGSKDTVLDIGCGAGNLTIPLSSAAKEVTGIDHESFRKRIEERYKGKNLKFVAGNFLDTPVEAVYDKILCYGVLHYLENKKEVYKFIEKALENLKPGGIAMFADLPNKTLKTRFLNSKSGRIFLKRWKALLRKNSVGPGQFDVETDHDLVEFSDKFILEIIAKIRQKGFNAYVYPQNTELPFGNTREDIIVRSIK